jgi:hypothetical protein
LPLPLRWKKGRTRMQERLFSVSLTWVRGSYFGEVASDGVLIVLDIAEHVEEEDSHVLVQVLVVEEELREEGQVLTVERVLVAVDLEDRHLVLLVAIDLVAGRVEERAVSAGAARPRARRS